MTAGRWIALDDPAHAGLFSFDHTAFRLETRRDYRDESEREPFADWLAGGEARPDQDWLEFVRGARAAGKVMQRVHVIEEPRTGRSGRTYLDFELALYRFSVQAGEDVRIIPVRVGGWPAGVPRSDDYSLLDSRTLVMRVYADDGQLEGAILVEDPATIIQACYARDAALHAAIPYAEYMASRVRMPAA